MSIPAQAPFDGGIRYVETNMHAAFREPYNTLSSALFILIALYWIVKLFRRDGINHDFLFICSFILLIGSTGGTLYHGLRRYPVFIFMDYLPILILCLISSIYFISKVLPGRFSGPLVIALYAATVLCIRLVFPSLERHTFININYALLASLVLIPTLTYAAQLNWKGVQWVILALSSFLIALLFRALDPARILPMGTHFLWHLFGAVATGSMFYFIYQAPSRVNDAPSLPFQ